MNNLAESLRLSGRLVESEKLLLESLTPIEDHLGPDHLHLFGYASEFGETLLANGREEN
jgi:hypothetical protein